MYYLLVVFLTYSCSSGTGDAGGKLVNDVTVNESVSTIITDTLYVSIDNIETQAVGGIGLHKGERFTGYATKAYASGQLSVKIFFLNGKKEGIEKHWFEDGSIRKTKTYLDNKLNGNTITYYGNGQKASLKNYENNVLNGVQEEWYEHGQVYKRQNYLNGREEGIQQAWTANGKIFANYEARNGRNFGLKRMDLCIGLKDEKIRAKVNK